MRDEDEDAKPEDAAPVPCAGHRGPRVERLSSRHAPQLRGTGQDCGVAHGRCLAQRVLPRADPLPNYLTGFTADMAAKSAEFEAWAGVATRRSRRTCPAAGTISSRTLSSSRL